MVAIACIGGVRADDEWKTVSLGGRDDFKIDVPSAVGDSYKADGDPATVFLNFGVSKGDLGSMQCLLLSLPYTQNTPREKFIGTLGQGDVERFCEDSGKNISNGELNDSGPMTVDGLPAGQCSAAYTDSEESSPGTVKSVMVVAGRANSYHLICVNRREDRDSAISAFVSTWESQIKHIQQSLRLPASEK